MPPPLPTLSHQGRGETQPRGQDARAPKHAPCVTSLNQSHTGQRIVVPAHAGVTNSFNLIPYRS